MATVGNLEATLSANVLPFVSSMGKAKQAFQQTSQSISQGSASVNQLAQQFNSLQNTVGGVQSSILGLSSKVNRAFGLIGAGFILPRIFDAAKTAVIDFNQQVDQASVALTNFLGSATASKEMISELQDFAARTPFQFKDLLGTTQSMMAMGVAADEVLPRMQAIGDAAAAMGGSPETLYRIQRALGQIQAKGRVQSEELLQLAEAGIPAYQYLADALGTTTADMLGDLKKGQVGASVAIGAILDGMSRDFGGMMEEQSKTMMGAMSTVMDYVQMTVGALFRPVFEALRDTFVALSQLLSSDAMTNASKVFSGAVAGIIGGIRDIITTLAGQLKGSFFDTVKAIGNLGKAFVRLVGEMAPFAKTILLPIVAGFVLVAKVVAPFVKAITSLVEVVSRVKPLMQVLAGLLIVKYISGMMAAGKATTLFSTALTGTIGKLGVAGKVFQFQFVNALNMGYTKIGALSQGLKMFAQTAIASLKAFSTAMIQAFAPMALIMGAMKVYQAIANKNKDLTERTKELTLALKEQYDQILLNVDGFNKLEQAGLDPLQNALLQTGENGNKLSESLAVLGIGQEDALATLTALKDGNIDYMKTMLQNAGINSKVAGSIAAIVDEYDKNDVGMGMELSGIEGITTAQFQMASALEELQDQGENLDLATLTAKMINLGVAANESTATFRDQAFATAEAMAAQGAFATESERALWTYQEYIRLSAEFERVQAMGVLTIDASARSFWALNGAIQAVIASSKDGVVEVGAFAATMLGERYNVLMLKQAYAGFAEQLTDVLGQVAETKGSMESWDEVSANFAQTMAEVGTEVLNMTGSSSKAQVAMSSMVDQFIEAALKAGYSEEAVYELVDALGVLSSSKAIIQIGYDKEQLLAMYKVTEAMVNNPIAGAAFGKAAQGFFNAYALLNDLESEYKNTSNYIKSNPIDLGSGGGASSGVDANDAYIDSLDRLREAMQRARQEWRDYKFSVADSIRGMVSIGSAWDLGGGNADKFLKAFMMQIKDIENFSKNMNFLRKKGLSENALNQILGLGLETGSQVASALAKKIRGEDVGVGASKTIKTINRGINRAGRAARGLGTGFANQFASTQVNASIPGVGTVSGVVGSPQYAAQNPVYITIQGAIDPVATANQIRKILNNDSARSGRRNLVANR